MAKPKYETDLIVRLYDFLAENPYATYEDMEKHFPESINANSLVKRLQRMGCVRIERTVDPVTGKIRGSQKVCVKRPNV